jgi:hypothetical protein
MAARSALRAVPLLATALGRRGGGLKTTKNNIFLASLRAANTAWVVARYPARGSTLRTAAHVAHAAAVSAITPIAAADYAARNAAGAAYAANYAYSKCNTDRNAARKAATVAVDPDTTFSAIVAEYAEDGAILERRQLQAAGLAAMPLWSKSKPKQAVRDWVKLENTLLNAGQDWQVWTNWYRARLSGDASIEALEVSRVAIAEEIWRQGPVVVNAHIAKLTT